MNYRKQGKLLDNDIREYLTTTISGETFSKRWGSGLFTIVKQLFYDRMDEIIQLPDEEEKEKQTEALSKRILMFCIPFL